MIIELENYQKFKKENFPNKKVVCTSGYFDPIHPGHISCLRESKKLGEVLVVVLNGDAQCVVKKGKPFQPAKERAYLIDSIKDVDYVVIYDNDQTTVCTEAIEIIKPDIFAKGGDRSSKGNVPEVDAVESNGGVVIYNVGDPKMWSSSNYLQEWVDFTNSKN
jgi:D-beta-D-heptose 7-phosphate kinase/D-beta-D-heptose 1-phosphate adenosyltransferase